MPLNLKDRLSVVANALSADPREAAQLARQAGFHGLMMDCYGSIDLTELSLTGRREWLRGLSSQDQPLSGLQVDLGRTGLGPGADVERQLQRLEQALEVAAGLRAGVFCVELGLLPKARTAAATAAPISPELAGAIIIPTLKAPPLTEAPPPPDPAFVSQIEFALKELATMADRFGRVMAFSSALSSLQSLHAAILPIGCPWFGMDVDPVGLLRDGLTIDHAFSMLGGLINHVRIRDAVVGDDRRTRASSIGQGNVDWSQFLQAVEAAGYSGSLTVDPGDVLNRAAAAATGLSVIQRIAEKI